MQFDLTFVGLIVFPEKLREIYWIKKRYKGLYIEKLMLL